MANDAVTFQGLKIYRDDGLGNFVPVGFITNLDGPTTTAKNVETTTADDDDRVYKPGLRDGGEVSFGFRFVAGDAGQKGLREDERLRRTSNYRIEPNDPGAGGNRTRAAFKANVASMTPFKGSVDSPLDGACSLKVSGPITYTEAT